MSGLVIVVKTACIKAGVMASFVTNTASLEEISLKANTTASLHALKDQGDHYINLIIASCDHIIIYVVTP